MRERGAGYYRVTGPISFFKGPSTRRRRRETRVQQLLIRLLLNLITFAEKAATSPLNIISHVYGVWTDRVCLSSPLYIFLFWTNGDVYTTASPPPAVPTITKQLHHILFFLSLSTAYGDVHVVTTMTTVH